jgi:uncharacterized protein (TIGR02118 family)
VIKRCGLIVKPSEMPFADFSAHWVERHTQLVRSAPGLIRYRVNLIDREQFPDSPIDGFSELWFETAEQMQAAFQAENPVKQDEANFASRVTVVIVDEHEIVG